MIFLKADTNTEVLIGPAVAVGDGFTPVTTLSLSTADEAELIKYGGATALTVTSISANAMSAITSADGYYTLDLSTSNTDTEGFLVVVINDDSLILPIRQEFMVVNANVYDSLFAAAATDVLDVNVTQWLGTAAATPTVAGVPEVDLTHVAGATTNVSALATNVDAILTDTGTTLDTKLNTAQADLDTITGTDGVTLATAQALYAPSKAGDSMALTAAAVDAVIDETLTSHVTADSLGVAIKDILADTADIQPNYATSAAQTTAQNDLDIITGATGVNLLAATQASIDAIETDTSTSIPALLPSTLVGGRMDSNVSAIANDATAATNLSASALSIVPGACEGTPSTTVIQTDLAEATDDHYIGRVVIFTSGAAAYQATDITDYTGSTGTITVTALTTAPAASDTFVVI